MTESLNLCMGCMAAKIPGETTCMECGYTEGTPYLPSYLAPSTILNDRYIVGKLLKYNGESGLYIGYDMVEKVKVFVREYMPDTLCEREKGSPVISVNQNNIAQYKALMSEFTELNKMLAKMRTLGHINPAIDLFAQNNTAYVILKYIDGMTLKQYLQENAGELDWDEVKRLFPPLLTTISLVHSAGVVHRGICPENIWVENGELKLDGFCIASERTANTELAPELYAGYAAPEQYSSNNWQGTWTDVYGMSAVLYRVLTGCMPNEAVSRIGNDTLCEPAGVNRNIPANVSKAIMNGMRLSGNMRIQTMTELVSELFEQPNYIEDEPEEEVRQEKPKSGKKKKKKKRSGASPFIVGLLTLGVGLVIAAFALFYLKINDRDNRPIETTPDVTTTAAATTSAVSEETTASAPEGDYVMISFVGRNYELVSTSSAYAEVLQFVPEFLFDDEVARGLIMEQDVEPDTYFFAGQVLNVKVSDGPAKVALPDYFGMKIGDYQKRLEDAGIAYIVENIDDPEVAAGYVSKTSKDDGSMVDREAGEVVQVYVSTTVMTTPVSEEVTEPPVVSEQTTEETTEAPIYEE